MTRFVNAAALVALAAAPALSSAQISAATERDRVPAGLALPVIGAAAAEEPSALGVNPAGVGFVPALALQYFHEESVTPGGDANGLYAADALGPLALGASSEWVRVGGGPSWRRSRLALGLSDGHALSAAVAWTGFSSRDRGISRMGGWDLGLTARPSRHLSLGAAALGMDARLAGARVPVRFDVGAAVRLLDDALTLSTDLLADDRGESFRTTHVLVGAAAETPLGFAVGAQLQLPVRSEPGRSERAAGFVALTWNAAHGGFTAATTSTRERTGWVLGVRASSERYRSAAGGTDLPIVDVHDELEPKRVLFFFVTERDPYGALVERLAAAKDDAGVAGLVVRIEELPVSAGRAQELRTLLAAIARKKPVLAYLLGGGTKEYWVATGATAIAAPPGAPLFVNGLASSQLYLKDALARLGVVFEVVKAGAYKSATEPLVRTEASPEARDALNAVLDDLFGGFVADVAAARKLPEAKVRAAVDTGLFLAEDAKEAGLVDAVLWPDEVEGWARKVSGRRLGLQGAYEPEPERAAQRWGRAPVVEVIRVEGLIASGRSRAAPLGGGGIAGADTVVGELRRAAADEEVAAIVLRVESPGGDGLASDLVWREVMRARQKGKVVVASMGDVAASGGYLAAAGADAIVAEPATLTGSIGVFAAKPDLTGLLGKLSIHRESFVRGENAQITSLAKPWSEAERKVLQRQIDAFYALFLARVAEGRKLPRADVEAVAAGRVWTGRQALERRLVDRLGTLADAVALARQKARIDPGDLVRVRRSGSGPGSLERAAQLALEAAAPPPPLARAAAALPELRALGALSELGPVLALPESWLAAP